MYNGNKNKKLLAMKEEALDQRNNLEEKVDGIIELSSS